MSVCAVQKNLLSAAAKMGRVFVITNAMTGWVEYSAQKYLPGLLNALQNVTIVSARDRFEGEFPGDYHRWKVLIKIFLSRPFV